MEHLERQYTVTEADAITLDAAAGTAVFSTPAMIMQMELTAKELLKRKHSRAETSVGAHVDIKHLAPSPVGATVRLIATLEKSDKAVHDFSIEAHDAVGLIGKGTHRRAVVALDALRAGLAKRHPTMESDSQTAPDRPATTTPGNDTLLTSIADGVLTITLNRPDRLNAMSEPMTSAWERLLDHLEQATTVQPKPRAIVLTGAEGAFCAGEDVNENAALIPEAAIKLAARRGVVCRRLQRLPIPTIAAVNGPCLGGGMTLALACDFVIATSNATFGLPEVKLGWPPAYFIDALTQRTTRATANRMALLGASLTAPEAFDAGLLDQVVPANRLPAAIAAMTAQIKELPEKALAETKALIDQAAHTEPGAFLAQNLEAFGRCRATAEAAALLRAFLNK